MSLLLILLVVLLIVGAFPAWPYSQNWGYGPIGVILLILLVYLLVGGIT